MKRRYNARYIFLSLLLAWCLVMPTFAMDTLSGQVAIQDNEFLTLDGQPLDNEATYLENVILVLNGIPRRITEEEYNMLRVQSCTAVVAQKNDYIPDDAETASTASIEASGDVASREFLVDTSSIYEYFDYSQKTAVSPYVAGGPEGATITVGESVEFTAQFNVSVSVTIQQIIQLEVGGSFSASTNSVFSAGFNVPANRIGHVVFSPRVRSTTGNYIEYDYEGYPIYASRITVVQPLKVGQFADGLYELELI